MEDDDSFEDGLTGQSGLVGELGEMCSQEEAMMRMETRQVDKFEMTANSVSIQAGGFQIDPSKAVKKYQRSSADKKYLPNEIRTIPACWRSIEYLLQTVLDFDVSPKPGFANNCYQCNYFEIYSFLRDRLRAVRVDLHLQNCVTDPVFVKTHEYCLRFELLSLYLLWGRDFGAEDKKFDLHMSLTALSQTIDPLTNAYTKRSNPTPVEIETEAEMTRYILILALTSRGGSKTFKGHFLKQGAAVRAHPKVRWAYETGLDFYQGNWTKFLAKFEQADFLTACALLPVVNLARTRVLWRMVRTNRPFFIRKDPSAGPMPPPRPERIPTTSLMKLLVFSTTQECTNFAAFHGLDVTSVPNVVCIPPRQLSRNPISWWMSSAEWRLRAGDQRVFPDYAWNETLAGLFHTRLGEEVGDSAAPDSTTYPKIIEGVLVMKYLELSKRVSRKEIVTASSSPPAPRKLEAYPTFGAAVEPVTPTPPLLPPPVKKIDAQILIPKPVVRPVVPIAPLSTFISTPFTAVQPVEANDHLKRSRDSPPVQEEDRRRSAETNPPLKKRIEEEEVKPVVDVVPVPVPRAVAPLPALPAMPLSGFDLLAFELGEISIDKKTSVKVDMVVDSPPTSVTARLVQREIDEGVSRMREIQIGEMRVRFAALKCLRVWRALNREEQRWKHLIGASGR